MNTCIDIDILNKNCARCNNIIFPIYPANQGLMVKVLVDGNGEFVVFQGLLNHSADVITVI